MTSYDPPWWCPPANARAVAALTDVLRARGIDVVAGQPLGAATTLGVGGAACAFAEIADHAALRMVLQELAAFPASDLPVLVIGRGSNMLIADAGWPGLAIKLGTAFKGITCDGLRVRAGGAASMPALAAWTATQGLAGLEFAAGIPATVGGSVRMNAGAHGGEVSQRLVSVDVALPGDGDVQRLPAADLQFAYRRSQLPAGAVIVAAEWDLIRDHPDEIRGRLDELRAWRRSTQPLRQRNCGSVFTNPEGESAGRLVEAAGLKGYRRGGAQVSERHANFIVVSPPCRAADVFALIADMRRAVHANGGPLLSPEVRLTGDFAAGAADA